MKNVIITGASNGIGAALMEVFNAKGNCRVIGISRSFPASIDSMMQMEASGLYRVGFDLSHFEKYQQLIAHIKPLLIDAPMILINNAGFLQVQQFEDASFDAFDNTLDVNLKAPFFLIQALLPMMLPGSHIVNISSMGGFQGSQKYPGLSIYSASKAALAVLTESLSNEFVSKKIAVNCLCLGAVQTEMLKKAFPDYQAKVSAHQMASYIAEFALSANEVMNGRIIPLTLSNP